MIIIAAELKSHFTFSRANKNRKHSIIFPFLLPSPSEDLYIVGKLWDPKVFHDPALIKDALMSTLRNLNLTYLDSYILQCPEGDLQFVDTWHEMEKLVDNFIVKSIGLSNFNEKQIEHLFTSARCLPVTNQFDCNPYQMQQELCGICRSKSVAVTVYNPFGSSELLEDATVNITD